MGGRLGANTREGLFMNLARLSPRRAFVNSQVGQKNSFSLGRESLPRYESLLLFLAEALYVTDHIPNLLIV